MLILITKRVSSFEIGSTTVAVGDGIDSAVVLGLHSLVHQNTMVPTNLDETRFCAETKILSETISPKQVKGGRQFEMCKLVK